MIRAWAWVGRRLAMAASLKAHTGYGQDVAGTSVKVQEGTYFLPEAATV